MNLTLISLAQLRVTQTNGIPLPLFHCSGQGQWTGVILNFFYYESQLASLLTVLQLPKTFQSS